MLHLLYAAIDHILAFILFHPRASGLIFLGVIAACLTPAWLDRKDKNQ